MESSSRVLALRQARQHLLEHGSCLSGTIDERIVRSWRRSLAAGLVPAGGNVEAVHLRGGDLSQLLARNHDLLVHARPVMEHLFKQVCRTNSMVILSDDSGSLIYTLGDGDFLCKAERVALTCGASWSEQQRGTNAIGTALAERDSVEIHGAEHFLERHGFLTCAAAPILSASGELAGILDISGDQHSRHPHTLGLVSMAACMIENRLIIAGCGRSIRLHLHARPEGIGTIGEGIITVTEDGRVAGANRAGLALLGLAAMELGATPLASLFDVTLGDLVSRSRRGGGQAIPITRHDGTVLFAQIPLEQAAMSGTRPRGSCKPGVDDALARLDTGDARWRSAADKVRRVCGKPIPVLIQGESGVGKELFARAVHDSGPRRGGAFVAINCAAVPENLIEAELFGYAGGAYTGARREGSPGRLREAHGGTLFLDEIGDMPLAMQTRLLRVLQERQIVPLGGGRPVDVDFSLVCASHQNLRLAIEQGSFRSDLYYRINGLTVHLPPLREREDFLALTERLLASLHPDRKVWVAPGLMALFRRYDWPGNLRQYANVLRTAGAMLDPGEECIDLEHLPDDIAEDLLARPPAPTGGASSPVQNLRELSRLAIRQAMESSRGNVSAAARRLGISRQTLYRKLGGQADSRR